MSFMTKKQTRKQLEEKNKNLIIEFQRRRKIQDEKLEKMQKAVDEIQEACDIILGYVIRAYGQEIGETYKLDVPIRDERYHITLKRTETGYELYAE